MMARWVVVLTLLGVPAAVGAQSFIFSRYATATSFSLYGGYGPGHGFGFVGLVQNPRSGYRESLVGAGWRVGTTGALTVAGAVASASDGWYAQLYILPSLSVGPFAASTTIEVYEPLDDRGARQFYFNPLTIVAPVARGVAVGGTGLFFSQVGTVPGYGAGPALQVRVPRGTVTLDLIAGRRPMRDELRLSFYASF